MVYVSLALVLIGLYLYIFKDVIKFKNYYLGRYFNKVLGLLLILFNLVALLLFLIFKVEHFFLVVPLLISYLLTRSFSKKFNKFIIEDSVYPKDYLIQKVRKTVRGIIINNQNEAAVIHIDFIDELFGKRDHFELPGGGIENNEDPIKALHREIKEELGYTIKDVHYLMDIGIEYHPLKRIDEAKVYVAYVDQKCEQNLQGIENEAFKEIKFVKLGKLLKIYKENKQENVGKLIYQRDGYLLKLFSKCK